MKRLITLTLLLMSCYCMAQQRNSAAVSYGLGNGSMGTFNKSGGPRIDGKSLHVFGFNYLHALGKSLFLETGIQLYRYNHTFQAMGPNTFPENRVMNMVGAPIKLRFEAGKYIFFNGGLTASLSKRDSGVSGIGAGVGVGVQFKIAKQLSIYFNPQANLHGLIPDGLHLGESNITFGISHPLSN
jgi:hypothetical protein